MGAPLPPRPAPSVLAGDERTRVEADLAEGVVGHVAGAPLHANQLLREWHRLAPRELWLVADKLVAARVARAEAALLGLVLDEELVAREVAAERRRQEAELARAAGGRPLEAFLRDELGQEPARYFEGLRAATLERLVAERVVRAWTLARESRAVRVLAVEDEEAVGQVRERVAQGEDFAALARELSVDDTASAGGLVPFLVDEAGSPLARAARLFEPGEVGGPVRVGGRLVLVRVEELRPPRPGPWREVAGAVERSLARHPVQDSEYVRWKLAMDRSHPVDLAPLEALLR